MKKDEDKAIQIFNKIQFYAIKLKIKGVNIKESFNNSWNLYFEIEKNQSLFSLQKDIYNLSKNEKYNPESFIPHITIHCDKDYNKLVEIKNSIMADFIEFETTVKEIGLYRIYPAERLK